MHWAVFHIFFLRLNAVFFANSTFMFIWFTKQSFQLYIESKNEIWIKIIILIWQKNSTQKRVTLAGSTEEKKKIMFFLNYCGYNHMVKISIVNTPKMNNITIGVWATCKNLHSDLPSIKEKRLNTPIIFSHWYLSKSPFSYATFPL